MRIFIDCELLWNCKPVEHTFISLNRHLKFATSWSDELHLPWIWNLNCSHVLNTFYILHIFLVSNASEMLEPVFLVDVLFALCFSEADADAARAALWLRGLQAVPDQSGAGHAAGAEPSRSGRSAGSPLWRQPQCPPRLRLRLLPRQQQGNQGGGRLACSVFSVILVSLRYY